jgi:hypothetical protein
VFGKTFRLNQSNNTDIDFGMGFDLSLFPDVFGEALRWIIDFANFSYSDNPWGGNAQYRGILNTGFRIDLSVLRPFTNNKFLVDFIFKDLFDDGQRSFSVGTVFGFQP